MKNKELVVKHLEMINSVVARMARSSFLLKGFSVTLVAASFFLIPRVQQLYLLYFIMLISIFIFWILDGYFVNQKRLFKDLFEQVRTKESTDFSMKPNQKSSTWMRVCFSKTLLIFHFGLALLSVLSFLVSRLSP